MTCPNCGVEIEEDDICQCGHEDGSSTCECDYCIAQREEDE